MSEPERGFARKRVDDLVGRYRLAEPATVAAGVNISQLSRQHPQRNPGMPGEVMSLSTREALVAFYQDTVPQG